jgi:hypothetical protein
MLNRIRKSVEKELRTVVVELKEEMGPEGETIVTKVEVPYEKYEIWEATEYEALGDHISIGAFNAVRLRLNSISDCMRVMDLAGLTQPPHVWYITKHLSEHDTFGTKVLLHPRLALAEAQENLDRAQRIKSTEESVERINQQPLVLEMSIQTDVKVRFERQSATFNPRHSMQFHSFVRMFVINGAGNRKDLLLDSYITIHTNSIRKKKLITDLGFYDIDEVTAKIIASKLLEIRQISRRFANGYTTAADLMLAVKV